MATTMCHQDDSHPPGYYTEREALLQPSSSSPPRFNDLPSYDSTNNTSDHGQRPFVRNFTERRRGIVGDAIQWSCQRSDLNLLFIVLFGTLAAVNIWLTVKSSGPDGASIVDWYFAGLMALVECALQITWVIQVWPVRVWPRWRRSADPHVVIVIWWLFVAKVILLLFNVILAYGSREAKLPFSWGLAFIAGFISVDFALAVVLELFFRGG